jgi:hypothetical protein
MGRAPKNATPMRWNAHFAVRSNRRSYGDRRQRLGMTVAKASPQRLSGACVEVAGDGVAAKGLTVGGGAGAAPVVVGELEEGGALAVVEIGTV